MVSSGARMTYDKSVEAKNPTHPNEDDLPEKRRKSIG